jgi:NADH:ubiquinone oxidoreductase subunit 2 (subunit N)
METAALAGYFLVISSCTEGQHKWSAALRYFLWSVTGSALILFAIAIRLVEGTNLTYPLTTGSPLADTLLAWGWSIKVGFLPWHFWLLGVYRALPVAWAAWFSVVPKGALLLNFLALLPPEGEALQGELFYLLATVSLVGAYAAAWAASTEIERLFWGSFAQAGYIALCAAPGAQAAGWDFWFVYGVASLLSFLYVEHPWTGRWGNAVGLLLLANLAALPPVLGFWVKVGLFWEGFRHLNEPFRSLLIGAAALATIGGFAVYGKLLWRLWQRSPSTPPWPRRLLYGAGALLLLGLGIGGLRWL